MALHKTITAQVLRSFCSCPAPRKTWLCPSDIALIAWFSMGSLALEILRDSLKLFDQVPELARQRLGSLFHAVVNMVLDEFFLRVGDGFLDGVQLLRQVHAGTARLQHVDHGREVALRAFQPCADLGELVHYLNSTVPYPIPLDRIREE